MKCIKKLQSLVDTEEIHCIAFMGDMTSFGKQEEFKQCVASFKDGVLEGRRIANLKEVTYILPGNHDLVRNSSLDIDVEAKFSPFRSHLEAEGFQTGHFTDSHSTDVGQPGGLVRIIALNSCYGCGEKMNLPHPVADAVVGKIAEFKGKSEESLYASLLNIDTPLIHDGHLSSAVDLVQSAEGLSVVIAHHNLLPQSTPRIAAYTELLNAGLVRDRLLSLEKPVVYLHGHLHQEGLEVISRDRGTDSRLVIVSAPIFRDGFNVVSIGHSQAGVPIGARVAEYRLTERHAWHQSARSVCLWSAYKRRDLISDMANDILDRIQDGGTWSPVTIAQKLGLDIHDEGAARDVFSALHELDLSELVAMDYVEQRPERSRIRRT